MHFKTFCINWSYKIMFKLGHFIAKIGTSSRAYGAQPKRASQNMSGNLENVLN